MIPDRQFKEVELRLKTLEQKIGQTRYDTRAVVQSELSGGIKIHMQQQALQVVNYDRINEL